MKILEFKYWIKTNRNGYSLKTLWNKASKQSGYVYLMNLLFAILSGITTIFVFPYSVNYHAPYLGWMAWISIVPLCYVIIQSTRRRAFFFGFITAFIYYLGSIYWMYTAIHDFAKYPAWAACVMVFFTIAVLSLFVGFACFMAKLISYRFRISIIYTLPFTWTLIDFIRNYIPFNGFPWNNLAYSQHLFLPAIQIADITGVYGVTFLIVLTNVSISSLIYWLPHRQKAALDKMIIFAPILLTLTFIYGFIRIYSFTPPHDNKLDVALIHGATPQELKDNIAEGRRQIAVFTDLSGQAVRQGADILIWPETIFIGPAITGKNLPITIENFDTPLILGAMTYQPNFALSNSAILVGSDAIIKTVHSKTHLVPFGEYIPKGFFFLRKLVSNKQKIIPGISYSIFDFDHYSTGVLICYEDVFPDIARNFTKMGANFLTIISNDGWFEGTSASLQHLTFSIFRAVENRRQVARAANRGTSAFISHTGRVMDSESALTEVSLLGEITPNYSKTIYTKFGDWFIYLIVIIAIILGFKKSPKPASKLRIST